MEVLRPRKKSHALVLARVYIKDTLLLLYVVVVILGHFRKILPKTSTSTSTIVKCPLTCASSGGENGGGGGFNMHECLCVLSHCLQ